MARILIIDDSAFTRRQLRKVLLSLGHEVMEAASGAEGLTMLESHTPAYVVTDLLMPEMDGFDFIDAVRKRTDKLRKTPILVLSADVQEASRYRTSELGAERFLNKPVKAEMIRAALEEIDSQQQAAG